MDRYGVGYSIRVSPAGDTQAQKAGRQEGQGARFGDAGNRVAVLLTGGHDSDGAAAAILMFEVDRRVSGSVGGKSDMGCITPAAQPGGRQSFVDRERLLPESEIDSVIMKVLAVTEQ